MSCKPFTNEVDDYIPGTNFQRDIKHKGANHFDIITRHYLSINLSRGTNKIMTKDVPFFRELRVYLPGT
jgi:hypothetical protein